MLADFVQSREIRDFPNVRDRKLRLASEVHLRRGCVVAPYAVTAWDEFQTIVVEPDRLPGVMADLRWIFHPVRLRIGIGIGPLDRLPRPDEAINVGASGLSLELAREAIESLRGSRKYAYRTALRAASAEFGSAVGLALRLRDALIERATDRQQETMRAMWRSKSQEAAAARLGVDVSTVSRTLRRGGWWEIEDIDRTVEGLLASIGPVAGG